VKYNFPVPRSRGLQNTNCDILINDKEICTRDIILYLLLGRIALTDDTTYEIETYFNTDLNTIEIEIPDHVLTMLERLGIGPNLQRYLNWLLSGMSIGDTDVTVGNGTDAETDVINCRSITSNYVLTPGDSVLVVESPAIITLPNITSFANVYGKRYDIKCRTISVEVIAADGIDDVTSVSLARNENLTVTPTVNGWVIL